MRDKNSPQCIDKPSYDDCLFVLGCDRSGTTLVQAILNSHPSLFISYEVGIINPLERIYGKKGLRGVVAHMHSRQHAFAGVDMDAMYELIQQNQDLELPDVVGYVYRAKAGIEGKPLWGDKRPDYTNHVAQLATYFPNSKFLHVVRDPRAVALSWAPKNWGPRTTYHCARAWVQKVGAATNDMEILEDSRTKTIKYEELLVDPRKVLEGICRFLNIPFSEAMLQHKNRDFATGVGYLDRLHSNVNEGIDSTRSRAWVNASPRVIQHIEGWVLN